MLRLGGLGIWVGWLVGWFLVFLVIEGETPLEVEAKLKGTLGWEVPWFWPVGRFLSGCSDPDSGRTLFKLQVFKDEKTWSKQRKPDDAKKPQPRQIFKVDWKTDRLENLLSWKTPKGNLSSENKWWRITDEVICLPCGFQRVRVHVLHME